MFNNGMIDREYRKTTTKITAGIVLLLVMLALLTFSVVNLMQKKSKAAHMNEVMINTGNRTDQIAFLDVIGFYQIATYGEDLGYYIAYDDNFSYIISIREKDFDYFAKKFDSSEYCRMWGYTDEIPVELKGYAIESLNEEFPDANLTVRDFEGIFGDLLLETGRDGTVNGLGAWFRFSPGFIFGGIVVGFFGLLILLSGRSARKSFKVLEESEFGDNQILNELNAPEAEWVDGSSLYLTDHYLVNVKGGINVVDYDDIFWAYLTNHHTNGVHDYDYLNLMTKDGRRIVCSNSSTVGKKRLESTHDTHEYLMNKLTEKNPQILLGYVKENIDAYNEMIKK